MRIGIIGAGNVGTTLGRAWKDKGREVLFGVRSTDNYRSKRLTEEGFPVGTVADAGAFGEVIVLATPWNATQQAVEAAGNLSGKIVIDCTNPLKRDLSGLGLEVGHTTSGAEQIAQWASGARVYKAFNQTGAENMADPVFGSTRAVMFVCGDDADSKALVMQLVQDVGFEAMDAGGLTVARLLEPLAMLWIHLGITDRELGRRFAFAVHRR